MELKNVKRYFPEEPVFGADVMYYIDENGLDFYESVNKFTKKYKCCVEPDSGIVRSVAEDAAHLYPVGFDIVETDKLPEGFDICGGWRFDGKAVVSMPVDYTSIATKERDDRMALATKRIDWLTAALEDGDISDDESAELDALRAYRTALRRLDLNVAPKVKWPEVPQRVA